MPYSPVEVEVGAPQVESSAVSVRSPKLSNQQPSEVPSGRATTLVEEVCLRPNWAQCRETQTTKETATRETIYRLWPPWPPCRIQFFAADSWNNSGFYACVPIGFWNRAKPLHLKVEWRLFPGGCGNSKMKWIKGRIYIVKKIQQTRTSSLPHCKSLTYIQTKKDKQKRTRQCRKGNALTILIVGSSGAFHFWWLPTCILDQTARWV